MPGEFNEQGSDQRRIIEDLIKESVQQWSTLEDDWYVDPDADMHPPDGKVIVSEKIPVKEAFYGEGTGALEVLNDGQLQLTVYFSPDNDSPATEKRIISIDEAISIFGLPKITNGLARLNQKSKAKS